MNRSRRGWGQATCCRVACVLLAVMPVSLLHAATIWVEGNVEQVAANGDGRFGGCMAELDIELADAGLDCTGRWVTFDCAGGYGVEDADRLLKAVGAAVVAEKSVAMLVSDEEKHGDYCLASRIKVQDEPHVDDDSDGDGVLDLDDDVPLDASETVDTDDDGIGDNADADDDNDGILDADDPCPIDPNDNCIRPKDLFQNFLAEPIRSGASPGLIAAIVDRKGVRAISAAGVRKAGHSQPLLVTDAIHIGSNTKAMTSVMLATLVRDGTFANGWNTTIGGVFPELLDEIHADYRMVSLWQLVTMTGGIKRDAENWRANGNVGLIQRRFRILRDNLAEPPAASTGEYLYSNLGYMVAGAMAERVTGDLWETLMQERLFAPLGMSSAGFGAPGTPGQVDQPWGHRRDPDGEDWVPNQSDNAAALGPAGTVHIAIEDWAKFMALWLPEVPPAILDRETLDELITPTSGEYAAGWVVAPRSWAEGAAITHDGSNTSWYTILWIAPEIGHAYVVGANSSEPDYRKTFWLLDGIVGKLIGHSLGVLPGSSLTIELRSSDDDVDRRRRAR